MLKNLKFFKVFGPPCRNPLANLDGSSLYARMCVGLCPTYTTTLDDAQENRNGRRLIIPKTGITSLTFWTTLQNPVGDGSIQMRQLDRGWIKSFSVFAYMPLFITVAEIQGRKVSKWSKIRKFFRTFWPTLWKPLGQPRWLNARMCAGLCRRQATALDAAGENRNGRRLSCSRRNPQNFYYVTQFLAHSVSDGFIHMRQLDRGGIKLFSVCAYMPLFLIVSEI